MAALVQKRAAPEHRWQPSSGARQENRLVQLGAFLMGTALLYLIGTAWYCWQSGAEASAALAACVLPFLPGDAVKIIAVLTGGNAVKRRLRKAGLV